MAFFEIKDPNFNADEIEKLILKSLAKRGIPLEEEKDHLESHFDELLLNEIKKEINKDNDFSRIQKIKSHIKENNYSKDDLNAILESIKKMYMVDGSFGAAEQMVYTSLQKLIKIN